MRKRLVWKTMQAWLGGKSCLSHTNASNFRRPLQSLLLIYSYFEKGCWKKCTRQSQKVLWVVLSSLFFTEIWKNGTWGHGHMFASAKGKHWQINLTATIVRNSVLIISHVTFRDCRVHIFSDNLSRNSCIQLLFTWSSHAKKPIL